MSKDYEEGEKKREERVKGKEAITHRLVAVYANRNRRGKFFIMEIMMKVTSFFDASSICSRPAATKKTRETREAGRRYP